MTDQQQIVIIDYTNWRGVRARRRIRPVSVRFESNQWHTETQWLLEAVDVADGSTKTFAMASIHSWTVPR